MLVTAYTEQVMALLDNGTRGEQRPRLMCKGTRIFLRRVTNLVPRSWPIFLAGVWRRLQFSMGDTTCSLGVCVFYGNLRASSSLHRHGFCIG